MPYSADPILVCVEPSKVDEIWPLVEEFIAAAFRDGRGDDSEIDVLFDLRREMSLLWIAWARDDRKVIAAATTKLVKTALDKICLITSCGGDGVGPQRWPKLLSGIETYAKAEGCDRVRIEGRKGWAAIFPDYRQPWIVLEKRLP